MRHALKESDNRLAAAFSLTTTTTRVVSVLGVEHTEASTATATTPTEQFQMMELMSASASNMNAVASILDAERVERIAGQVQHKALLTDTLSELERPTKGSTSMVKGLQSRAHN
jgi:hypothetical protein